jgi:hypothetical protein
MQHRGHKHLSNVGYDCASSDEASATDSSRHAFDLTVACNIAVVLNHNRERSSIELAFGRFHDHAIPNGEYRCA